MGIYGEASLNGKPIVGKELGKIWGIKKPHMAWYHWQLFM